MFGQFGHGFKAAKVKTLLNLAKSRIHLMRNKRLNTLKQMRRDIATQLANGQDASAQIRVEHIMREQNVLEAYDFVELFCELIVVRLPIIESQKDCPPDLREAISSIMWAAPRCADLPELMQAKQSFQSKYGKEFTLAAEELRPGSGVNRLIITKLSVAAPSGEAKLKLLMEIAKEHNVEWDHAATEESLVAVHEDLLNIPVNNPQPSGGGYAGYGHPKEEVDHAYRPSQQNAGPSHTKPGAEGPGEPKYYHMQYDPSAPSKSQLWIDPENMNEKWAGRGESAYAGPPSVPEDFGGNPLNYPPGPPAKYGQHQGYVPEQQRSPSGPFPREPEVRDEPAPFAPPEGYTTAFKRKQEDDKKNRMSVINENAFKAKQAAMRAAEAAKAAAELASAEDDDSDDDEALKPVKPAKVSFLSTYTEDDVVLPSAGGSFKSSDDAPARGTSNPPQNFATGSIFDDYVEVEKDNEQDEEDGDYDEEIELELPDPPTHRGRGGPQPPVERSNSKPESSSGLPDLDDLTAKFRKFKAESARSNNGY